MRIRAFARQLCVDEAWQGRVLIGLVLAMAVVHVGGILWTSGRQGPFIQGDARSYFAYLPSLVLDGDIDLRNQFAELQPEGASEYPFGVGFQDRAQNPFPIAPALMWLPGYVVGLGLDAASDGTAPGGQPLGYGMGAALATAVWSILLVALGAEATRRLVRACVGVPEAFAATIMAWLGTPALYYTVISPLYSHAPAWVAVSLMLLLTWRAAHERTGVALWAAAGGAAGWVVAVRLQDVPLVVIPLAVLGTTLAHGTDRRKALLLAAAWLSAACAAYMVQGVTWYWLHGVWVPFGGTAAMAAPTLSNLAGILFSVGYRGWISWTPIVLPAVVGLGLLARRGDSQTTRRFALWGIVGMLGMVTVDLLHPFGAGAAFGGRRYVSATPLIALGLGTLLDRAMMARTRAVAWVALPVLTVWALWLLLSYELLIIRHGLYPTLLETIRYAVGLGVG